MSLKGRLAKAEQASGLYCPRCHERMVEKQAEDQEPPDVERTAAVLQILWECGAFGVPVSEGGKA